MHGSPSKRSFFKLKQWVIGIDFDNTIVSYDSLFYQIALEQQLIGISTNPGKKVIRDMIRLLPDGENRWQELQALVYGPRIQGAVLIDGVRDFISSCRASDYKVHIVSHKTEVANFGDPKLSLRKAALDWMEQNGFFEATGLGFSQNDVYFGATRQEKLAHIARLGCTHFIDDLEEVFLEPGFPMKIHKILYAPQDSETTASLPSDVMLLPTWQKITEYIFFTL
jgi:hypothetical protein